MDRANVTEIQGAYHFAKKIRKFRLKVKWNSNFTENPFGNCRLPSEVVLFIRRKFLYYLVNFPVSSPSSAEHNYEKSNCKWWAPSRSVGLLTLEKPLPLYNGNPNRFILTNSKYPHTPPSAKRYFIPPLPLTSMRCTKTISRGECILASRGRAPFGADQKERGLWGRECRKRMPKVFADIAQRDGNLLFLFH